MGPAQQREDVVGVWQRRKHSEAYLHITVSMVASMAGSTYFSASPKHRPLGPRFFAGILQPCAQIRVPHD
jgi:hypothetical protein